MSIRVVFSLEAYGPDGPLVRDRGAVRFVMKKTGDQRTVGLASGFPFLDVDHESDIYPELTKFVSGYEIDDSFLLGLAPRKRGVYREGSAEIVLERTIVSGSPGYKAVGRAKTFAELNALYRKIRAGQVGPEEDWEVTQGSPQLDDLRKQLDNANLQLGKLGTEQAAKDVKIAELNERVEGLYKLRDDLRKEFAGTYTKLTEKTRELADKDGKIHDLDLELRLMKERVRSLMVNIWRDMFKVRWWQGKNAVRRVVGNNMRAEPSLFNLMTPEVSSRIRDFMFKEE